MSITWNKDIAKKYQELAVQDPSEFEVGRAYYTSGDGYRRVFARLETDAQHYKRMGLKPDRHDDDTKPAWIIWEDGSSDALTDNNIGDHYNPWFIFDNKETMEQCRKELNSTIETEYDFLDDDLDSLGGFDG